LCPGACTDITALVICISSSAAVTVAYVFSLLRNATPSFSNCWSRLASATSSWWLAVMPEHLHVLIGEPLRRSPTTIMQVLKQRFARQVLQARRTRRGPAQTELWSGAEHTFGRFMGDPLS